MNDIINDTLEGQNKKYGDNQCTEIEFKYNFKFSDELRNKTKNVTTCNGVNKTKIASRGRFENIKVNKLIILTEGSISRNTIITYMNCKNLARLWRIFFTKIANKKITFIIIVIDHKFLIGIVVKGIFTI